MARVSGEPPTRCAVVGLGVLGASTLLALARAGVEAVGYDRWDPGHPYGASGGGETRIFRSVSDTGDPAYTALLARSRELWSTLDHEHGGLFERCGALTVGPGLAPVPGTDLLTAGAAAERYPAHRFDADDRVLVDAGGGLLDASGCVAATVAAARAAGARVHAGTPVRAVLPQRGRVEIRTDAGTDVVDAVALTTGRWPGFDDGTPLAEARRVVLSWFPTSRPDLYAPTVFPPGQRNGPGSSWSFFPSVDARTVKINMQVPQPAVPDPETPVPAPGPDYADAWGPELAARLDGLDARPERLESHVETYTPHRRGLVRLLRTTPPVLTLTGFSGRGYKYAPAVGELAARALLTGKPAPVFGPPAGNTA